MDDNMHIYLQFMNMSVCTSGSVVCSHPKTKFYQRIAWRNQPSMMNMRHGASRYWWISHITELIRRHRGTTDESAIPRYQLGEIELRGTDVSASSGDYAGGFAVPSLPAIMAVNIQHNKLSERNVVSSTSPCLRFFGSQDKGVRAPAERMCF